LYSLPNTIGWAGHVTSVGEKRNSYIVLEGGGHLENLDLDEKVILSCLK
jgi:hypothetical protein